MSAATLRQPARCASSTSFARKATPQVLKQLARMNPNQFSSYVGVKLLLPAKGRLAMVPQGSAAARKPVQMSFLGVGAPEALLVAIVALVVFGPKGLADAARSLGTALRSFQPTIKEVVQVSQELKGTLEKELGIDELRDAARPVGKPLDLSNATMSDPLARVVDPDIEAKRAASAQMAWGATPEAPAAASPSPAPAAAEAPKPAAAPAAAAAPLKDLAAMSVEELEAEINRRRAAAGGEKRV